MSKSEMKRKAVGMGIPIEKYEEVDETQKRIDQIWEEAVSRFMLAEHQSAFLAGAVWADNNPRKSGEK